MIILTHSNFDKLEARAANVSPFSIILLYNICRGLDPIVFAALCGVASGMTGFIIGGVLFNTTWKLLFRKKAAALQEVSKVFTLC